jgi:integrase
MSVGCLNRRSELLWKEQTKQGGRCGNSPAPGTGGTSSHATGTLRRNGSSLMPAPMVRTRHPGIFKRGSRYVAVYTAGGKQRKESARTLDDARRLKATRTAQVADGEFHEQTRVTFHAYAREWVETYRGRARRGFRESTREDYRRLLDGYALRFFSDRIRVSQVTPRHIAQFINWLCEQTTPAGKPLSDSTVRNAMNPVRACLATAVTEGLIRHNPTTGASLPHRPAIEGLEVDDVRPLSRSQLGAFLALVHPRHRLMFRLLASTGLRVSELVALQWRHLHLDGASPHVKVRRAIVRGRLQPPKSRHGRRDVPLSQAVVSDLRKHRLLSKASAADDLAFPSLTGTPLNVENLRNRHLKPVAEEIGAPWVGFHTFRHTCASLLFERGANAKQVQRWLGHHAASFTLDTYIHLLPGEFCEPLELSEERSFVAAPAHSG